MIIDKRHNPLSPCTETFESANFGDGRIIYNTTGSSSVYEYQYFLTDHLGSTRMVVGSDGEPVEAVNYRPYGGMLPVSSVAMTPALAVREKFTGKEFDTEGEDSANGVAGVKAYYFGRRYYDPELGVWMSRDAAGQFWNPYGYSGNPVLMVDEDGNFFFVPFLVAMAYGAVIGAGVGGATYAISAGVTGNFDWGDFGKALGMGALGGAITGGIGSFGTSLATNIAYSTLGNVTSTIAMNAAFGNNITGGMIAGAVVGGMLGGFTPGFNGVSGGKLANGIAEVGYSSARGAAMGAVTGGVGAAVDGRNIVQGIGRGAAYGALGGAVGAGLKVGAFGTVTPKSTTQLIKEDVAARYVYGTRTGNFRRSDLYGSVNRSGGAFKWLSNNTNLGIGYGFSAGRNNLNAKSWGTSSLYTHESMHYFQQQTQGIVQFYKQGYYEQYQFPGDPYSTPGTNEYEANWLEY